MKITERLAQLQIELPVPPKPIGNFSNFIFQDSFLYISGQGPIEKDGRRHLGKVGRDVTVHQAKQDARLAGINVLAVINQALGGELDRVDHIVKITGFVNSSDDFFAQPEVVNGCSDLMVEVLGEKGCHARTAIGVAALPFNISVEIEAIVAIH